MLLASGVLNPPCDTECTNGSGTSPSLSHLISGAGFPLKLQAKVTSMCSNAVVLLGLESTVGITTVDKRENSYIVKSRNLDMCYDDK